MDYEKAHKDLVAKVKKAYLYAQTDSTKKVLEDILPELRESEDERIRKAIFKALSKKDARDILLECGVQVSDALAYLEKQKELFKSGKGLYYYDGDKTTYCGYPATEENPYDFAMSQQEKQKPAWNEEDETAFGDLMWCIEQARKSAKDENDMGNVWFAENWVKNRLRSLRPSQKQEWSEEDEKMLSDLRNTLGCLMNAGAITFKTKKKFSNWLKSLRPQPREEIYHAAKHDLAIKFMNYLDENRPEGKMSLSNGECEDIDKAFKENDWAKILRYAEKYGK